jgi:TatD DNase family protein
MCESLAFDVWNDACAISPTIRFAENLMGLIDSHAHLTYEGLVERTDEVLARAEEYGVERVITIGTSLDDARNAIALARRYPGRVHPALGFHPHHSEKVTEADFKGMAELWDDPAVVAFGEMGLDYHYDFADRVVQRNVFERQLQSAERHDRPIIIHAREAHADVVSLLLDHGFANRRVVFHCFTGTREEADAIASHGWRISFTGVVTFKKSNWLQDIARAYPADKIMVETDSPYLSPEPVRRVMPNEPAHVAHTAMFLANLRGEPFEGFSEQTRKNTCEFFGLGN